MRCPPPDWRRGPRAHALGITVGTARTGTRRLSIYDYLGKVAPGDQNQQSLLVQTYLIEITGVGRVRLELTTSAL